MAGCGSCLRRPRREREQLAEQRAAELLRSCVNEHEWRYTRAPGFLPKIAGADDRYAYLIYPHKPIVAFVPATGELLSEYCVAFADDSKPYGSTTATGARTMCLPNGSRSLPTSAAWIRKRPTVRALPGDPGASVRVSAI